MPDVRPPDPVYIAHNDDPECPGHDVQPILAGASRAAGHCLCVHPFMNVIDFSPLRCGWCGQPTSKDALSAAFKDERTAAITAAVGSRCRDHPGAPP